MTDFWQVSLFGSYWQFGHNDFNRVLADIELRPLRDDRLVALSLAFRLYVQAQRPRKWREALKAVAAKSPVLRAALQTHLHPPPLTEEQKRWKRHNLEYRRRQKKREVVDAEREQKWKDNLAKHAAQLRDHGLPDPTAVTHHQHYLHERCGSWIRNRRTGRLGTGKC